MTQLTFTGQANCVILPCGRRGVSTNIWRATRCSLPIASSKVRTGEAQQSTGASLSAHASRGLAFSQPWDNLAPLRKNRRKVYCCAGCPGAPSWGLGADIMPSFMRCFMALIP